MPIAENAVKIARVLGVSVEYLVTGEEIKQTKLPLSPDIRIVVEAMNALDDTDRRMILNLVLALQEKQEKSG
jgi:ABC-type antimicrobial peptide transport system ATPase subunit